MYRSLNVLTHKFGINNLESSLIVSDKVTKKFSTKIIGKIIPNFSPIVYNFTLKVIDKVHLTIPLFMNFFKDIVPLFETDFIDF